MKNLAVALVLGCFALTASAQQKPEDMIKVRKAGMSFMSYNLGRIKANLDGTFNKDEVVAAANVVAATANSSIWNLYAAGTDKDIGNERTRAKAETFLQSDKFGQRSAAMRQEAGELVRIAAAGDAAAVRSQFGKVAGVCKGCHDDFRRD